MNCRVAAVALQYLGMMLGLGRVALVQDAADTATRDTNISVAATGFLRLFITSGAMAPPPLGPRFL